MKGDRDSVDAVRAVAVMREQHRSCEACGYGPPAILRRRVLQVHHVVPVAQGGTTTVTNLAVLCPTCHRIAHALWPATSSSLSAPVDRPGLVIALRQLQANPEVWFRRYQGGMGLNNLAPEEMRGWTYYERVYQ